MLFEQVNFWFCNKIYRNKLKLNIKLRKEKENQS